jgi:hypothetical protein
LQLVNALALYVDAIVVVAMESSDVAGASAVRYCRSKRLPKVQLPTSVFFVVVIVDPPLLEKGLRLQLEPLAIACRFGIEGCAAEVLKLVENILYTSTIKWTNSYVTLSDQFVSDSLHDLLTDPCFLSKFLTLQL